MIRRKTGMERLRCFFTGLRSYRCRDCDQKFRALDRRVTPRDDEAYRPSEARTRALI
jgi:hypothetical protein